MGFQWNYKHTIYACYAAYVASAVVNNFLPLLFVTFQSEYGISLTQLGTLVSVNFAVQLIVDAVSAKFADKIGYRACVVTAAALEMAGFLALCLLPEVLSIPFWGIFAAVILYALGSGLNEVVLSPIMEALPNKEKASAMSLLHSFYCWGQMAVVLLSTLFFVTVGIENWKILAALWALVPLASLILFAKVPMRQLCAEGEQLPMKKLFRQRLFYIFLMLMLCAGAAEIAMSQWASLFAEKGLGVSKTIGDIAGPCLFAAAMGTTRLIYGKYGNQRGLIKWISLSAAGCILCYGITALSPLPALSLAGCALCGAAVGILWPGVLSLSAEYCPRGGTAMFALLAAGGDVGCTAGPLLVGLVSDNISAAESFGSLKVGMLAAMVFPLLMLVCVILLERAKNKIEKEKKLC